MRVEGLQEALGQEGAVDRVHEICNGRLLRVVFRQTTMFVDIADSFYAAKLEKFLDAVEMQSSTFVGRRLIIRVFYTGFRPNTM
jgi:hypothetical protein